MGRGIAQPARPDDSWGIAGGIRGRWLAPIEEGNMEQVDQIGRTLTLIHYVFQTEPERIACMPNMVEFHSTMYHPNYQRTNEPRAVTCPACVESVHYPKDMK